MRDCLGVGNWLMENLSLLQLTWKQHWKILNVVRCKCKADGSNPCGTRSCSCQKHGFSCMPACKNCLSGVPALTLWLRSLSLMPLQPSTVCVYHSGPTIKLWSCRIEYWTRSGAS